MKTIDELKISPWPWSLESYETTDTHYVIDFIDQKVVRFCKKRSGKKNARLIAAAPEMYQCLTEAVVMQCHDCKGGDCYNCEIRRWKDTLAKAEGERK